MSSAAPAAVEAGLSSGTAEAGIVEQLTQLAALRDQGVLTDAEFAAAKANLLAQGAESSQDPRK